MGIALLHPQGAWVEALECLLLDRPDVDVVIAHTSPDWVRGALEHGVDVLVLGVSEERRVPDRPTSSGSGLTESAWGSSSSATPPTASSSSLPSARVRARGWSPPPGSTSSCRAIHGVFRGETCVPPALLTVLLETLLTSERTKQQAQDALSVLSTRERQILECLAQGMTRKQIAERFTLSPHTVRTHINHVLTKLGVHTTLSAVSIARKALLESPLPVQA